jgi:phage baseplate assembly protein W
MTSVRFPFDIVNGKVVVDEDPGREIESKVVFCLSTQVGERVMNPDWGIDILNSAYSMGASTSQVIDEAIRNAFRTFFPEYQVKEVKVTPNLMNPTYIVVDARWGKFGSAIDLLSKVGVQLPGGGEYFEGEGY